MNCPYTDCTKKGISDIEEQCPQCSGILKICTRCGEASRAFSNYCRGCGERLANEGLDWEGFKGGPERTGFNPYRNGRKIVELEDVHHLALADSCRSLLSCDEHLIAVSKRGRIEVLDTATRQRVTGWKVDGPITCEPCVHRGSLYLGAKERIVAYSLGALTRQGQPEPRWEATIRGTPTQALLAVAERLYINAFLDRHQPREIQVIDDIGRRRPTVVGAVAASHRLSSPAGGSKPQRRIVFLSEDQGRLSVYRADHPDGSPPEVSRKEVSHAPSELKHFVPIAALRNKVFAVFGSENKLCSIDAERGAFKTVIQEDVQGFSLSGPSDGVLLQGGAIFFLYRNKAESLTPDDRINVPPVIVGQRAVFVGMKDGRIRWYDLDNPAVIGETHLADQAEEVTALVSFKNYVAAGGSRGTVRLFRLKGKE